MIERIAKSITGKLINNHTISEDEFELYQYGIELLISSLIGITFILVVGILFFNILDSICFLVCFIVLRSYSGGFHANSYLKCNISSVTTFIIVALASKYLYLNVYSILVTSTVCLIIISIFAPIENENKHIEKTERIKYKIISIIICLVFVSTAFLLHILHIRISSVILFSTISITVLVVIGKISSMIKSLNKSERSTS